MIKVVSQSVLKGIEFYVDSKEISTLSGVALGGIVGGVLVSPLGPWCAISGSTVGATIGGWVISKVLKDFYVDLQVQMEEVKTLPFSFL